MGTERGEKVSPLLELLILFINTYICVQRPCLKYKCPSAEEKHRKTFCS